MSAGHIWNGNDRCELCGDKDWMADRFCSKNPEVAEEYDSWSKMEAIKHHAEDAVAFEQGYHNE